MKQGGTSANAKSSKSMSHNLRCTICGRTYAIKEMLQRHERQCKQYNRVENEVGEY